MSSIDWLRQLNSICDQFEDDCRLGKAPRFEDFLDLVGPEHKAELLSELIAVEVAHCRKRNQRPELSELLVRFPEYQAVVVDFLTANSQISSAPHVTGPLDSSESSATLERWGPSTNSFNLPSSRRIGDYELLEEIGRGGMGVVFKARQVSLNRIVALKMILSGEIASNHEIGRFRAEAAAVAKLNHPDIVSIHEIGEEAGRQFFSMEYIEGPNLQHVLRNGTLPQRQAAQLIMQVAEAVDYAHRQHIIHRDLKPANILLDASGQPHVTDFGLARHRADGSLTATGEILGTPSYIPPEQVQNLRTELGPAVDVYSMGALLYATLTGRPPFHSSNPLETLRQVIEDEPVTPRSHNSLLSRDLETICLKCLEKTPGLRFTTARELADELQRFLNNEPVLSRPVGSIEKLRRWLLRRPAVFATASILMASAGLILYLIRNHQSERHKAQVALNAASSTVDSLKEVAQSSEAHALDALYAVDISRAAAAWRENDPRRLAQILEKQVPKIPAADRRGFEWHYLHRQSIRPQRVLLELTAPQYKLCFSPDGNLLAVAGADSIVRFLNPETGEVLRQIPTDQVEINGLAFSPDASELATSGDDGTVRILNPDSGDARLTFRAHPGKAFELLYSPDGRSIVSCGDNPVIRIFDAQTGNEQSRLEGHLNDIHSLVIDPRKRTLATSSYDNTARLWNCDTGQSLLTVELTGRGGPVVYSEDRKLLVVGTSEGFVQSKDLTTGNLKSEVRQSDGIMAMELNPDGVRLAAGDRGGCIHLWTVNDAGEIHESQVMPWQAHRSMISSLVWSKDGSYLISAGRDGSVIRWDLPRTNTGRLPRRFQIGSELPKGCGERFYLIPGADRLIVCTQGGAPSLTVWNWKTGETLQSDTSLNGHTVRLSPDGRFMSVSTPSNRIGIYHAVPQLHRLPMDPPLAHWQSKLDLDLPMQFFPDSRRLVVCCGKAASNVDSSEHSIWLFSIPDLQHIEKLPIPHAGQFGVSPDGRHIAIGNKSGLTFWDVTAGRKAWEISQTEVVENIAFRHDGKLLAMGGNDRLVTVLNTHDGSVRFELSGHQSRIMAISFSPDGRTLATASHGSLKLWHMATGQELLDLGLLRTTSIGQIQFSEDGRQLFWSINDIDTQAHSIAVFETTWDE